MIANEVERKINELSKMKLKAMQDCVNAPEGILLAGETSKGYKQTYILKDGKRMYLSLKNADSLNLARELAQRDYAKEVIKIIDKELYLLESFKESYRPELKHLVGDNLPKPRKNLVTPYYQSIEDYVENWYNTPYPINKDHPETRQRKTDKGDIVRSKSEEIIANYLFKEIDKVYYHYEQPLRLEKPKPIIIHPDFTIISRRTGKIFYLEHGGMIGLEKYGNDFVWKVGKYAENGIFLGEQLLYTYESTVEKFGLDYLKMQLEKFVY